MSKSSSNSIRSYGREDSESDSNRQFLRLKQGYLPDRSNILYYHYKYFLMIFDFSLWEEKSVAALASTVATLYATLLVCTYVAFSFTELVTYPHFKDFLEVNGFFVHLFLISDLYFLFIIYQVAAAHFDKTKHRIVENEKSHGSLTIRFGALLFGSVAFVYILFQLIDFLEKLPTPCHELLEGINAILMLIFVFLQVFVIFAYPRLNLLSHKIINRYGTMHVVATNIILWIRTLVRESLEEMVELSEFHTEMEKNNPEYEGSVIAHSHKEGCNDFLRRLNISETRENFCDLFRDKIMAESVKSSLPFLYPFVIEFSLIGASVAYLMSEHIGKKPSHPHIETNRIRKPNPILFLKNNDFSHSVKGIFAGVIVMGVAIINIAMFFGFYKEGLSEESAEYASKVTHTIINIFAIVALVLGIAETQQLEFRNSDKAHISVDMDMDMSLLRFTSMFSFLYQVFTIITGAFNTHITTYPNELSIVNGSVAMIQVALQILFIYSLKSKVLPSDKKFAKPGRQTTIFLFLCNIAQWLVISFEIQKVRANLVEADFYGFIPWVIIQRVTLPPAIFFHFHSAVVFVELFKEVFSDKAAKHEHSGENNQA